MDETPQDRDPMTGRFKPGYEVISRPTPSRKATGQFVKVGPKLTTTQQRVRELRKAMLNAVSNYKVRDIVEELVALCLCEEPQVQLAAMKLFFERVFGRPVQEVHLQEEKTQTRINVNLKNLTDAELQQMLALNAKAGIEEPLALPEGEVIDAEITEADAQP